MNENGDFEEKTGPGEVFTQRMRATTRNIHNTSDHLVNAKLGVTMSDDSVWAEGLLVFYEIFKYLEEALDRHKDSLIGDLLIPGMARTKALETDLSHYLGDDWRDDYVVRPEVKQYLAHLKHLDELDPYLLIPYIYHLYMGLFSGGQVLKAKRFLSLSSLTGSKEGDGGGDRPGYNVTNYEDIPIGVLKKNLKTIVNDLAEQLDEETREAIIKEGPKVFELNNIIIGSVQGVDRVLKRRLLKLLIAVILLLLFIFACYFKSATDQDVVNLEEGVMQEL